MRFSTRAQFAAHPKPYLASTYSLAWRIRAMGYLPILWAEFLNHFSRRRPRVEITASDYLLLQTSLKLIRASLIYGPNLNAVRIFLSICLPRNGVIEAVKSA